MITIEGLTRTYGHTLAVDDVTFTAASGRVTGILGPNGAGKSTTMRILVGLTRATSGTAVISGRRFADLPNPGTEVGVLLDASAQHAGRTGREILTLAQRVMGLRRDRVEELLDLVSLTPDEAGRRKILAIQTGKMPLAADVDLDALARRTDRFSGADLENLVRKAGLGALRADIAATEIPMRFFEESLKETRSSVTPEMAREYERLVEELKQVRPSGQRRIGFALAPEAADGTTSGADGNGSGNQTDADATVPVDASGNQVTVIGDGNEADSTSTDSTPTGTDGDTTAGQDGTGSGNQTSPAATASRPADSCLAISIQCFCALR